MKQTLMKLRDKLNHWYNLSLQYFKKGESQELHASVDSTTSILANGNATISNVQVDEVEVPSTIDDKEKIVKVIFSPLNFNLKTNKLKANTYRVQTDDLSVNRLDYTNLHFCKKQGIELEKSGNNPQKIFYGIALLFAKEIRQFAKILYQPVENNPAHAEIVTGHKTFAAGETASAEYIYITDELAAMARVYIDSDTETEIWLSENASEILRLKCP